VIAALRTDLGADGRGGDGNNGRAGCIFETMDELERYCYGVASTVGVICVRIWGWERWANWSRVRELAVRRGLAFQLTNVLRDIGEDADTGRLYVPAELLETHGLSGRELATWAAPERCAGLIRELTAEAQAHYAASSELNRMVRRDGAATLWAMTRIYQEILDLIDASPRLSVGAAVGRDRSPARASLSSRHKATIAGRAVVRSVLGVR
jgi:phytoene/squalene synthetase